jgi:hypothetical protein
MKFEITDQQVFRVAHFTIEGEDGKVYVVNMEEGEFMDNWNIMDDEGNEIEDEYVCSELMAICEVELK